MATYGEEFYKHWYNTTIIEQYLNLLTSEKPNSYFLSVDFLKKYIREGITGIIRWIKRPILDIGSILFPINVGNHWILVVADTNNKTIVCYDGKHMNHQDKLNAVMRFMMDWEVHSGAQRSAWSTLHGATPKQYNNNDCGPWILAIAECIAVVRPINFTEKDMPLIRIQHHRNIMNDTIQTPPPKSRRPVQSISKSPPTTEGSNQQTPPITTAMTARTIPDTTTPHPTHYQSPSTRKEAYVSRSTKRRRRRAFYKITCPTPPT